MLTNDVLTKNPIPLEQHDLNRNYLWGKPYLMKVLPTLAEPGVMLAGRKIVVRIRPGMNERGRQELLDEWYRGRVQQAAPPLIAKWEMLMVVKVAKFVVLKMKGKWGSCSPDSRIIRLNSELAKKPPECLEYIVVHQMVHLFEPTHSRRFEILMNQFMHSWRAYRECLNGPPAAYERWVY